MSTRPEDRLHFPPGGIIYIDAKTWRKRRLETLNALVRDIMTERDALLQERQKTHGSFEDNARISQRLKQVMRAECKDYETIAEVYKESLDMIALKLSRILSGQHTHKDHWDDIAGYAKLASEHDPIPF